MTTPRKDGPRVRATPIDLEYQVRLRAAIQKHGLPEVADKTGLAAGTVCAIASGVGCHESSKKLARLYVCELNGAAR